MSKDKIEYFANLKCGCLNGTIPLDSPHKPRLYIQLLPKFRSYKQMNPDMQTPDTSRQLVFINTEKSIEKVVFIPDKNIRITKVYIDFEFEDIE